MTRQEVQSIFPGQYVMLFDADVAVSMYEEVTQRISSGHHRVLAGITEAAWRTMQDAVRFVSFKENTGYAMLDNGRFIVHVPFEYIKCVL